MTILESKDNVRLKITQTEENCTWLQKSNSCSSDTISCHDFIGQYKKLGPVMIEEHISLRGKASSKLPDSYHTPLHRQRWTRKTTEDYIITYNGPLPKIQEVAPLMKRRSELEGRLTKGLRCEYKMSLSRYFLFLIKTTCHEVMYGS